MKPKDFSKLGKLKKNKLFKMLNKEGEISSDLIIKEEAVEDEGHSRQTSNINVQVTGSTAASDGLPSRHQNQQSNFSILDIIEEREIVECQVDSVEWTKECDKVKPQLYQIWKDIKAKTPLFETVEMEECHNKRQRIQGHV